MWQVIFSFLGEGEEGVDEKVEEDEEEDWRAERDFFGSTKCFC